MIVADTNLIVHLLVKTDRSEEAQGVFDRDPDWLAPPLWRHELLNVLATSLQQGASLPAAVSVWKHAIAMLGTHERGVDMLHALQLSLELGISAYDAQFLALARQLDLPLITEDRRLRERAGPRAQSMAEFCAGPAAAG